MYICVNRYIISNCYCLEMMQQYIICHTFKHNLIMFSSLRTTMNFLSLTFTKNSDTDSGVGGVISVDSVGKVGG